MVSPAEFVHNHLRVPVLLVLLPGGYSQPIRIHWDTHSTNQQPSYNIHYASPVVYIPCVFKYKHCTLRHDAFPR